MFGTEFEFIKEYKPYESKSEIIENIINNDVEELIDVKQNKPIIKPEEKLEKETKKIKKKEKQPIKEIKEESTIKEELSKEIKEKPDKLSKELKEDINRLININKMYGPEYEIIKEYEPYVKESKEIENILDNNIEELIDIKYNKPIIKSEEKVEEEPKTKKKKKGTLDKKKSIKDTKKEPSKETKSVKKPTIINKMYGSEYEYIKVYKPYESDSKEIENILDNNIEELIDIKYNKPIIKSEEKVEEEKPKIKKKKKGSLDKQKSIKEEPIKGIKEDKTKEEGQTKETVKEIKPETIIKPIITNKMFGPEYEYIKEYKPFEIQSQIKEKSIKDDIEKLIEKSLNKPLISNKLIEKKKDNIKESKEVIKEIKPVKPINTIKMFGSEFENIKEYISIEPESESEIREIEKTNKIKENLIKK